MKKHSPPKFSGIIFCDKLRVSESGKINCYGIFTTIYAWGYPTSLQSWSVAISIYGLPLVTNTIAVSIINQKGIKKTISTIDITGNKLGNTIGVTLSYQFESEGLYTVEANIVGSTSSIRAPLVISTQDWPLFSKRELNLLKKNTNLPKSIQTAIFCADCSRTYMFEATPFIDHIFAEGIRPFPSEGMMECDSCGHILFLRDIEGKALYSIKAAIALIGGSNK